jgi:predicted MPP superfamily phosphohydrolase
MRFFLLTFFLLYGGLHYYLFVKANAALALGTLSCLLLILVMLFMVFAPLLVHISERHGFSSVARLLSFIGYSWMGFVFLCFWCFFLIDLYRLFIFAGGLFYPGFLARLHPSPGYGFFLPLLLSLSIALYGYFEAGHIRTERIVVKTPKLPREAGTLKIAQISDVHLGMIVRDGRLARILQEVKRADPDIFISTGDLVDAQINRLEGLAEMLREINPRYGKLAVTGNHEFFAGLPQALEFTRKAGFRVLRGEGLTVAGLINFAGVDDPAGGGRNLSKDVTEKDLLSGLPRDKFTVLLKHRPELDENALGLFDLQASGHTHQGQIFPFRLLTRLFFPYDGGSFQLPNHSFLHVSRGSGTWGPPIRFLAPPEVTVYELIGEGKTE